MSDPIGVPRRAVAPVDSDPSANLMLSMVPDRTTPRMSDADRAAHAAAQHLSPRGVAVLNRLVTALGVS